ncbi:MAG: polyphenol oxidase family protein [Spirochaetaceae bacterium]|nr:polyphenol oxidase family protein [Spirochaetaceae bacterium]MCF7947997.1 polyphenol oxidase family protein [Spirochaetia bacterium]MCF7952191.1 polyphenol oxidase family protein [Spirochaetaceae bacterium]
MLQVKLERDTHTYISSLPKQEPGEPDIIMSLKPAGDMSSGGSSRTALLENLQVKPERFFSLKQIHSQQVYVSGPALSSAQEGDGLVAGAHDHVLGVSVADCMPIFLFHAESRNFAVVHSGWKGTGIALQALGQFRERYGIPAEDVTAVLGPSIRSCCYQVDEARAQLFRSNWGRDSVKWRATPPAHTLLTQHSTDSKNVHNGESTGEAPFLDLLSANLHSLQQQGLGDIRFIDECTACTADLGSFRREGPEQFTHMLAIIGYIK